MATELDISDITTGSIDGTGAFDVLMRTVGLHLTNEYAQGRITGDRYAQSYTEALIATLDQATRFIVSSAQVDQQDVLHQAQIDKIYKEIEVMGVQMDQIVAQTGMVTAQTAQVSAQEDLTIAQTAQTTKQTELTTAQIAKVGADTSLVGTQEQLVTYQGKTEQAKYTDTIDGAAVTGVVGKQKEVYAAQAKGFKDSALQAATKIMVDTWSVRRTTDEATQTTEASGLYDGNIGNAVTTMFTNLNIPEAPYTP